MYVRMYVRMWVIRLLMGECIRVCLGVSRMRYGGNFKGIRTLVLVEVVYV